MVSPRANPASSFDARQHLTALLRSALASVAPAQGLAEIVLERPKQASHGDFASNLAMQLARELKTAPRQIAERLVRELPVSEHVAKVEIAGAGFINFTLTTSARSAVVAAVLAAGDNYGRGAAKGPRQVRRLQVEFVSANPTGPLHVGHGRQAALGDALCHLMAAQGWSVTREFYYNDAGVQIGTLAISVQARCRGLKPGDRDWPEAAYNGDYIADIAAEFLAQKTVHADDRQFTASGDINDLDSIRQFAVAYLRHEQDLDLQAFGVRFDHYYLESSLYSDGRVEAAVQALITAGKTYEQDGALWLRTTDDGDDKDRVMRKSDGSYTYFVPDVAYHITKWRRGFEKVINIQGSDHHGTIARVRAGLQACGVGIPAGYPDYVLHKMVTVMRGGEEVKISKRAGSYVTLRDLIDWSGRDAVRFFLISRKADTEFVFDVDLALKQSDENPVYYVQYAHARISSILNSWGGELAVLKQADLSPLTGDKAQALLQRLGEYPDLLADAARDLAPHQVAFYLKDLAADFHSFYNAERVLVEDERVKTARLALLAATQQVLRNGLSLLGVSAPDKM